MVIAKQVRLGSVEEELVREFLKDIDSLIETWPLVVEKEKIDDGIYRIRVAVSGRLDYIEDYYTVRAEDDGIRAVGGEGVFQIHVARDGGETVLRIIYRGYSRRAAEKLVKEILLATYKYIVSRLRELRKEEREEEEEAKPSIASSVVRFLRRGLRRRDQKAAILA